MPSSSPYMPQDHTAPATRTAPACDAAATQSTASWLTALRPAHWIKNLLLFVPLLAAHRFGDTAALGQLVWAFISFSLLASALYLHNDLQDLDNDCQHPDRSQRPLAAGRISPRAAGLCAWLLGLASVAMALPLGIVFCAWLLVYGTLVIAYSHWIKYRFPLDLLALAAFYLLRITAGAAAAAVPLGPWLPLFAGCTFAGLAILKRYRELLGWQPDAGWSLPSSRYHQLGATKLFRIGASAGLAATLVLFAYSFSPAAQALYPAPELLGLTTIVFALWQVHMWRQARQLRMGTDPVLFALRDRPSLLAAATLLISILLAAAPASAGEPAEQLSTPAPFGLRWGMQPDELRERAIYLVEQQRQGSMISYLSKTLPFNLDGARNYTLLFDAEHGLVRVQYLGQLIREDLDGSNGRAQYRALKLSLLGKYGVPEVDEVIGLDDTLKQQGFYACLQSEECGWWHTTFRQDGLLIRLQLHGSSAGTGFLTLDYQSPDFQDALARWEWLQQRQLDRAL